MDTFLGEREDEPEPVPPEPTTWRERIWTAHPDTMLNTREVAEAIGAPPSRIYAMTCSTKDPEIRARRRDSPPIPFTKMDGSLVFRVGEVRGWLRLRAGGLRLRAGE